MPRTGQQILQILHKYKQNLHIVKSPKYELYLQLLNFLARKPTFIDITYRIEFNDTNFKLRNLLIQELLREKDCKIPYTFPPRMRTKSFVFVDTMSITGYCLVEIEKIIQIVLLLITLYRVVRNCWYDRIQNDCTRKNKEKYRLKVFHTIFLRF